MYVCVPWLEILNAMIWWLKEVKLEHCRQCHLLLCKIASDYFHFFIVNIRLWSTDNGTHSGRLVSRCTAFHWLLSIIVMWFRSEMKREMKWTSMWSKSPPPTFNHISNVSCEKYNLIRLPINSQQFPSSEFIRGKSISAHSPFSF